MKEKAIASTAITEDGRSDLEFDFVGHRKGSRTHSRAGSAIGRRVVFHARRVSRGCLH